MTATTPVIFPESSSEGTKNVVGRWFIAIGQTVKKNEPLLEIDTDKTTIEIPSPADGVLSAIAKNKGDTVGPLDVLGQITAGSIASESRPPVATAVAATATDAGAGELTPAVRRMMKEHGILPTEVHGSGRGGRVTVEDVQKYLATRTVVAGPGETATHGRMVPHSTMQRAIAAHMVKSVSLAPHVTAIHEVDFSNVIAHRNANKQEFQSRGIRLTLTAYVVHAAARAMADVPEVNSRFHDDALEMFTDADIGVVVAVKKGLLVPVIRQAQNLDLSATAAAINGLSEKARHGLLTPAECRGSTFAITNHGVAGSLIATPIIHQPHSAILGIGKVQKRAVVIESGGSDVLAIRPMAYITLTLDHRVLDATTSNAYLCRLTSLLETWR
ncbi:MAG: 2-oxo acid dehydrogenase subunit E2 [Planctomycetota bacterium]